MKNLIQQSGIAVAIGFLLSVTIIAMVVVLIRTVQG